MLTGSKRTAAIFFAALLAGVVILVAATSGIGKPGLPNEDAVAFVEDAPDGEITQEQFDAAIEQSAVRQQLRDVPAPGTPQYDLLQQTAMADLLLTRWVTGEAGEVGIEVSDREIDQELETIIRDQFGGQEEFDRAIRQLQLSDEEARERVRLQLLSARLQEDVLGSELPEIPEDEIADYYDENIEQFETPESRDVRTLLNPDEAEAQDALERLEGDDSPAGWKEVTKELSTDEATSGLGGLRQGVVEGQNEPQLDEAIFSAPEGELVGPIETEAGFYVLHVETVDEASTQPLDEQTSEQIEQTLAAAEQQRIAADYQTDFVAKWRARTVCGDDFAIDRCSNPPPAPDPCAGDDEGEEPVDSVTGEPTEGCPAFVPSTQPVSPSDAGDPTAVGKPQGPQGVVTATPALPPGAQPIPGAPPGAPPGTVPPGG